MTGLLTDALTEKQILILVLLAKGYTTKEIGGKFGIHENTAQRYVAEMCDTIHANTPAHAVAIAIGAGIIQ